MIGRGSTAGDEGYPAFLDRLNADMDRMHHGMHAMTPSGSADIDFLAMMIPHHQGAVDMAAAVLAHGRDPLVRSIAESILAAQSSEIAGMRGRLGTLRGPRDADRFPPLSGLRG